MLDEVGRYLYNDIRRQNLARQGHHLWDSGRQIRRVFAMCIVH